MAQKVSSDANYMVILKQSVYMAFIIHFVWALLFIWLEVPFLVAANIASCFLYIVNYFLVKNEAYRLYFILSLSEISIHACLSTFTFGWEAGFHYYGIIPVYGAFFFPKMSKSYKCTAAILSIFLYIGLYFISDQAIISLSAHMIDFLYVLNIASAFLIIALLGSFFRSSVDRMIDHLNETNEKLNIMASTDSLTGLFTRRKMYTCLDKGIRGQFPFFVLLLDIDYFKQFNDRYGHECGDKALVTCAKVIEQLAGETGSVSRWGGEEFLVMLRSETKEEAAALAEKIRHFVAQQPVVNRDCTLFISVTIGLAEWRIGKEIEHIIHEADCALYEGKKKGRNCVVLYDDQTAALHT